MLSGTGEKPTAGTQNNKILPHAPPLPCPRCKSVNTKFCYYNNYNLSQPRHFCKSCRRYWTHGGTLRNVPVGGGTRKNSKRCRSSSSFTNSTSTTTTATANTFSFTSEPEPEPMPLPSNPNSDLPVMKCENSSENLNPIENQSEKFISVPMPGTAQQEPGFMVGCGSNIGYGFAYGHWGFGGSGDGGELLNGDCFTWPSLAISTPTKGSK